MKLSEKQLKAIDKICMKLKLNYVRVFGSATLSKKPRDIDLAVGGKTLTLANLSYFISEVEKIFIKPIDVIELKSGLSPTLIIEIAKNSKPIWERPRIGRQKYAVLIDQLVAIAQDEKLSFPKELRVLAAKRVNRRLRVT